VTPGGAAVAPEIGLDVTEVENDYPVKAEIPGAKKDDVRVTVNDDFI
jgi:HSP20 family molecular chaperone IbpA